MPFAKVPRFVVFRLEHFGDGDLTLAHSSSVSGENTEAERIATREAAASGGRTEGRGSIETVEFESISRHRVEMGRFQVWVIIESYIAPALVIAH